MELQFVKKEDAPEMPRVLYKYRTWKKPEHKRLLTHSEIYYAAPNDFNEVTECNLERDYDSITEQMIWDFCMNDAMLQVNQGMIHPSQVNHRAKELYESNLFHDEESRKESERLFREHLNKELSIFSASENASNERLWSTFAAEKRGYCVGIDFTEIYGNDEVFGACGRVEYYDESNPPKILPISMSSDERVMNMMKVIYSLPRKFETEEEFRFSKMHIENRQVALDPKWIAEVIIGSEMSKEDEKEIVEIVKAKYPNAELKRLFVEATFNAYSVIPYK